MPAETIVIASDHGAVELKNLLTEDLERRGYGVLDLGTNGTNSVDYPDFADALAAAIREGRASRGVLLCGSGIGMSIAANRHRQVRAALCHDRAAARMTRQHNDANVLALAASTISEEEARACLHEFLGTPFEGDRHARRVAKLS